MTGTDLFLNSLPACLCFAPFLLRKHPGGARSSLLPLAGVMLGVGEAVGWGIFNGKPGISRDLVLFPPFPASKGHFPAGGLCCREEVPVLLYAGSL